MFRSIHRCAVRARVAAPRAAFHSSVCVRSSDGLPPILLKDRYQHLTITPATATPKMAVVVTLNRPDLHNAFNEVVISELTHAFTTISKVASDNVGSVRAVVLAGNGKSFSAGADLSWMKKMSTYTKEQNRDDSHKLFDMFAAIHGCSIPVIGRVNGAAMGGGCGLVACTDFAFGLSEAMFGFTEVKLGLIPAVISPFSIAKIGRGNAGRYFLTGERFDATEAVRIGLLQKHVATPKELDALVDAALVEISGSSPHAVQRAKQLIERVSHFETSLSARDGVGATTVAVADSSPRSGAMKGYTSDQIASIRVSSEGQEGLKSFFEKRAPAWKPKKENK